MDIEAWLQAAVADAERRGIPELTPLLEALASATRSLRDSDITVTPEAPLPRIDGQR
ncbi:MAG: hypothetical protein O2917_11230 [Acidobacteria bacterium]|nr:hypothetical protein [Acidobacteriota bacterium]